MRWLSAVVLVVLAAPSYAAAPQFVSWRPRPWRPPVAAAALRFDPDTPGDPGPDLAGRMAAQRAALAATPVQRHADGSHYAVLGGLARRWTVARVAGDGSLVESCVPTEAEARALVAAPKKER